MVKTCSTWPLLNKRQKQKQTNKQKNKQTNKQKQNKKEIEVSLWTPPCEVMMGSEDTLKIVLKELKGQNEIC